MTVGADRVAAAVARVVAGGELLDHLHRGRRHMVEHGANHVVALHIGVGVDPVGDLQREEGQPDRRVEGARGEPVDPPSAGQSPALGARPEPDVVPLLGVAVHLLLKGELLLASEQEQRTHRRLRVALLAQRGSDDPPTGRGGDRVGPRPAGRLHRRDDLFAAAHQGQIHRIAEQAVAGARPADEVVGYVDRGENPVQARQDEVREQPPEQHDQEEAPPAVVERLFEAEDGQPHRGQPREHEEDPVEHNAAGHPPGGHRHLMPGLYCSPARPGGGIARTAAHRGGRTSSGFQGSV